MVDGRVHALPFLAAACLVAAGPAGAQDQVPATDRRAEVRTLNTAWTFEPPRDAAAWQARARKLREQVLVAAGLWPLPPRRALHSEIFDRTERGDYSVEKVFFESYPGFYVTGNLYRPLGRTGPFPGVLSPHGHWPYGRLENSATGSVPARALSLARQGYVVFSHDMVGYNDSRQVDHRLLDPRLAQWGIGSLSLHLWNSIRALDFLESLPDVDPARLACTGASGGATQAFLLAAVDERVRVLAPVNMISHTMQGGDVCENAPNLRLDASNMEIAALAAPRPMLMVSATGDWTRDTPRVEFPVVQAVYDLLGARENVETVQFDAGHNYNRDSREAVYAFFGRHVLGLPPDEAAAVREKEYDPGQPAELLVFYGRERPPAARSQEQIVEALVASAREQIDDLLPRDTASLRRFQSILGTSYAHALAASWPEPADVLEAAPVARRESGERDLAIGRRGQEDRVPLRAWAPGPPVAGGAVLVVHPDGIAGVPSALVDDLRGRGRFVVSIDAFDTGSAKASRDTSDRFFTTYNRTDDALRVQDILTALAWTRRQPDARRVCLVGLGRAGLWALLAAGLAPGLDAVVADVDRFPTGDDDAYLHRIFVPLFRRAGGFETAVLLSLGARVYLHDTGEAFEAARVEECARLVAPAGRLRVRREPASQADVVAWLVAGRQEALPARRVPH
jgi:dienelactone hydrolase